MASAFRSSRVDFIPADDVLEKIFGDKNSVEGIYNEEESDIDRQLENFSEESRYALNTSLRVCSRKRRHRAYGFEMRRYTPQVTFFAFDISSSS